MNKGKVEVTYWNSVMGPIISQIGIILDDDVKKESFCNYLYFEYIVDNDKDLKMVEVGRNKSNAISWTSVDARDVDNDNKNTCIAR